MKLRVLRDGDYRDVVVEAGENQRWRSFTFDGGRVSWPADGVSFTQFLQPRAWSDIELVTLTPGLGRYFGADKGVLVARAPDSAVFGLQDGDVILSIGGREPQSGSHAMRILRSYQPGEAVELKILRDRRTQTLAAKIPADSKRNVLRRMDAPKWTPAAPAPPPPAPPSAN